MEKIIILQKDRNAGHVGLLKKADYPNEAPQIGDKVPIHGITFFTRRDMYTRKEEQICITVFDGVYEVVDVLEGAGNELLFTDLQGTLSLNKGRAGYGLRVRRLRDLCDADIDFIIDPEVSVCLC